MTIKKAIFVVIAFSTDGGNQMKCRYCGGMERPCKCDKIAKRVAIKRQLLGDKKCNECGHLTAHHIYDGQLDEVVCLGDDKEDNVVMICLCDKLYG